MRRTPRASIIALASLALLMTGSAQALEQGYGDKDIVDTAVAAGDFETLVTAVQAAGLVEVLRGDGPFTVFAPTDAAFAKLPEGTVEALLQDPERLKAVLTYHVIPGKLTAADVVGLSRADTVNGQSLSISVDGDSVMVNDAEVVATDVMASNGVIHVIDSVILPSTEATD